MRHPLEQYHHYLHHKNFGEECTVCPHVHPELETKMKIGFGVISIILLTHIIRSRRKFKNG